MLPTSRDNGNGGEPPGKPPGQSNGNGGEPPGKPPGESSRRHSWADPPPTRESVGGEIQPLPPGSAERFALHTHVFSTEELSASVASGLSEPERLYTLQGLLNVEITVVR